MQTPASIPALVNGVALGRPPREISVTLRFMMLFGRGQALLAAVFITSGWFSSFPREMLLASGLFLLVLAAAGIIDGRRHIHLLVHGKIAVGTLLETKAIYGGQSGQTSYDLTFRFLTYKGEEIVTKVRTKEPGVLQDEALEPLLYDPDKPSQAALLDALPGSPRLGADGRFALSPRRALRHLGLALLASAMAGAIVWMPWW